MLLLNAQLATVNGEPFERERTRIVLPGIGGAGGGTTEFAQFRRKAESFLPPTGPEDLFGPADLDDLFAQLEALSTVMSDIDDSGE